MQESVTNALRHAQATQINIRLIKTTEGALQLSIQDNGVGMNICNVDQSKHFGLLGMRERVQALHGTFNVDSLMEQGTQIMVTIPARGAA